MPTGGYKAIRNSRITDKLFERHLLGEITLGIYSTDPDTSTGRWLCWDIDDEQETALAKLINWLSNHGIVSYRESVRPGRSGHLWTFYSEPVCTRDLFKLGSFGRLLTGLRSEIFPKQAQLNPGSLGNLVRLPLGRHQKPSAHGVWGLFQDCSSKAVDQQLLWFIEQPITNSAKISSLVANLPDFVSKPSRKRKNDIQVDLLAQFPADWPMRDLPQGEIEARCPHCALRGWDTQCKNLNIKADGTVLFCHRGCGFKDIMNALTGLKL